MTRLDAVLDELASVDPVCLTDEEVREGLLVVLRGLNQLTGAAAAFVASFDARRLSDADSCRTTRSWLQSFANLSQGAATGHLKRAKLLREMPALAQATRDGTVSAEHVSKVVDLEAKLGLAAIKEYDAILSALASGAKPSDVAFACERIRAHIDPDGARPDPEMAFLRRGVTFARCGSMVSVRGQLDPEGAAMLTTALDALMRPPSADDLRTPAQRRADALVELARLLLTAGALPTVGGERPHIGILITPQALLGQPTPPNQQPQQHRQPDPNAEHQFEPEPDGSETESQPAAEGEPEPQPDREFEDSEHGPQAKSPPAVGTELDTTSEHKLEDSEHGRETEAQRVPEAEQDTKPEDELEDSEHRPRTTSQPAPEAELDTKSEHGLEDDKRGLTAELPSMPARATRPDPRLATHRDADSSKDHATTQRDRRTNRTNGNRSAECSGERLPPVTDPLSLAGVPQLPELPWMNWVGEVPAELARRIACDCDVWRAVLDPATGLPLEVGRTHRLVPHWIRRALHARDRGCRWPGCEAPTSWTDAHHLVEWYYGGQTNIDNLLLLCRYHHARVHEGQWRIVLDPTTGEVAVFRPDGSRYEINPSRPWTGPNTHRGDKPPYSTVPMAA